MSDELLIRSSRYFSSAGHESPFELPSETLCGTMPKTPVDAPRQEQTKPSAKLASSNSQQEQ